MSESESTAAPLAEPTAEELRKLDEEMTRLVAHLVAEPEQLLPYSTDEGTASDLRKLLRDQGYRVTTIDVDRGNGREWRVSARRFSEEREDEVVQAYGLTIPLATCALFAKMVGGEAAPPVEAP